MNSTILFDNLKTLAISRHTKSRWLVSHPGGDEVHLVHARGGAERAGEAGLPVECAHQRGLDAGTPGLLFIRLEFGPPACEVRL